MTELEREIHTTLVDLERAVESMSKADPKPDLLPFFTRLDEFAGRLSRDTDSMLLHYLQRKSYQKAREFLENH